MARSSDRNMKKEIHGDQIEEWKRFLLSFKDRALLKQSFDAHIITFVIAISILNKH